MSDDIWESIKTRLNKQAYMGEIERGKERIEKTAEIFTPSGLVIEMLQSVPLENFRPGQTVLDPACGDGQFLLAVKWIKVLHFQMPEERALADIYGVDIMRDNVDLCRKRLGGGNIIMGNPLDPRARLEGQSAEEHSRMIEIFS